MKNATHQNRKGFTIVELVIVIAVIAILAAVLIPTFSGIVQKANESSAKQAVTNEFKNLYNNTMATPNQDFPDGLVFTYGDFAYTYFDREMIELEKVAEEKTIGSSDELSFEGRPYGSDNKGIIDSTTDIAALIGSYSSSSSSTVQDAVYVMPKGTYTIYSAKIGSDEFYFFTTENLLLEDYQDGDLKCYSNVFCKKARVDLTKDDLTNQMVYVGGEGDISINFSNPTMISASGANFVAAQKYDDNWEYKPGNSVSAKEFAEIIKDTNPSERTTYQEYLIYFTVEEPEDTKE